MATFALKEGNTADIDPELLTVNLLGSEPDPDDLVITPQNVQAVKSEDTSGSVSSGISESSESSESSEGSESSESSESSVNDLSEYGSIDTTISKQTVEPEEVADETESSDEDEIKAIEDLLRSKKSSRAKKQKASEEKNTPSADNGKHKIDPIVIVSFVVAAILIFVFAAYFLGFFDNNHSLNMTLDEFSASYAKTDAYKALSSYGFSFPDITLDDETASTDTSKSTASSDVRTFSAYITNSVNYQMAITGNVNKSDSNIKSLRVIMLLSSSSSFKDVLVVYAPYVQVLYPDMSTQDAATYLSTLYTSKDPVTVKGDYGLAFEKGTSDSSSYLTLYIISSKDANAYISENAASNATSGSSAADTAAVQATTSTQAETTAAS